MRPVAPTWLHRFMRAILLSVPVLLGLLFACGSETSDGATSDGGESSQTRDAGAGTTNSDTGPEVDSGTPKDGSAPKRDASADGATDAKGDAGPRGAPKSILVSVGLQLDIYDLSGNVLQTVAVPAAHREAGEGLRGVVEDSAGRVHVFAGTFHPLLATWDGTTWTSRAIGWTANVVHYGHLAAVGDVVLSTGMNVAFSRYNTKTGVVDFVPGSGYVDVNKGADGKLYAVDAFDDTYELDATTLAQVRKLPISPSPDLIATDVSGGMHGAWTQEGGLFTFPPAGPATEGPPLGIQDFQDIDIAPDGTFIFCGGGKLVIGHLGAAQTITKALPFSTGFCSFGYVPR